MRCKARTKTCRACGYRFTKEDTDYTCPECGEDRRCQRNAVTGYQVCQVHGAGSARKGRAGGRPPEHTDIFRPELPQRVMGTYLAALEDDRLYQLRSDIAILEARKHDLLKRVDSGESGQLWRDLKHASKQFQTFRAKGDVELMSEWLDIMLDKIDKGYTDTMAWAQAENTIDRKRKLTEAEFRHIERTHRMISVDKFMLEVKRLMEIIQQRADENTYELIMGDVYEMVNVGDDTYALPPASKVG